MFRNHRHASPGPLDRRARPCARSLVAGAALLITGAIGLGSAQAGSLQAGAPQSGSLTIQPTIAASQNVPAGRDVATQVIYIVPVAPVTPGIRRAPVADPVIYVIEQDESDRASVRAVR